MTEFQISTCAACDLDRHTRDGITHLLSIDSPGKPTPTPGWFRGTHIHVYFDDVENEAEASKYHAKAPTESDVRTILEFGAEVGRAAERGAAHLLVHCMEGRSRSPAAAYAILAQALGAGREEEALKRVLERVEHPMPNLLVIALADRILGRAGRLAAVAEQAINQEADAWKRKFEERLKGRLASRDEARPRKRPDPPPDSKAGVP